MQRRLLLIVIPALILAGVWLFNRWAETWQYVVPAAPGELLYVAAFDDFEDEWEQSGGRNAAQITEGVMQIEVGEVSNLMFAPAAPIFSDFDLHAEAQAVDGPENNGFGLVFRQQDPNNLYYFLISSNGWYQVIRVIDGEERELSDWVPSEVINQGLNAPNTLRVIGQGDTFAFYINGERVDLCIPDKPDAVSTFSGGECFEGTMRDTLVDETFAAGHLGVVAITESRQPGVVVEFDHFTVTGPEDEL